MRNLVSSIQKHPWKSIIYVFICFSVCWTIIEAVSHFFPTLEIKGCELFFIVICSSIIYSLIRIRQPNSISFRIRHTNTAILIKYGDVFEEEGIRCIAVNNYFDSEIGMLVSDRSLHGIFISRCFGGHSDAFDRQIDSDLMNIAFEIVQNKKGKVKKYPIGTSANLSVNNNSYICFALSRTNLDTLKAEADIATLLNALNGLYEKARNCHNGAPIILPLVGSGLSGVGLPPRELLDLIILSIIAESKKTQIANIIKIILTRDRMDEIDINEVKNHWR